MSKITSSTDLNRVPEDKFNKYLVEFLQNVVQVVNGNLDFGVNIRGNLQTVVFSAPNTSVLISHGLGRAPTGYLPFSTSAAMSVYEVARTNETITLRASAAGTATLFFF